jgi:hypothetical protein
MHDGPICYFFFKDETEKQSSINEALCALLHQLLSQNQDLIDIALPIYESRGNTLTEHTSTLWKLLLQCSDASESSVICVFDGLDEASETGRQFIIENINSFSRQPGPRHSSLKFLVTGRPYFDPKYKFSKLIEGLPPHTHLAGEDESIGPEIQRFVESHVKNLPLADTGKAFLAEHIGASHKSSKTYLWARLVFEVVTTDSNMRGAGKRKVQQLLSDLPSSVFGIYENILQSRSTDGGFRARLMLHIVLAAVRPLTVQELNVAFELAQDLNNDIKTCEELELQTDDNFKVAARALCGSLLTFIDGKAFLLHQTVKQFLEFDPQTRSSSGDVWRHSFHIKSSNYVLGRACILFLLLEDFDDYLVDYDEWLHDATEAELADPYLRSLRDANGNIAGRSIDRSRLFCEVINEYAGRSPFLEYAAKFWIQHYTTGLADADLGYLPAHASRVCDISEPRFWTWFLINDRLEGKKGSLWDRLLVAIVQSGLDCRKLVKSATTEELLLEDAETPIPYWHATGDWVAVVSKHLYLINGTISLHSNQPRLTHFGLAFEIALGTNNSTALTHLCKNADPENLLPEFTRIAIFGDIRVLEVLIKSQTDPANSDDRKRFPWEAATLLAIEEGITEPNFQLLFQKTIEEGPYEGFEQEALISAVRSEQILTLEIMLQNGAHINPKTGPEVHGNTPLMQLAEHRSAQTENKLAMLNLLLHHGADAKSYKRDPVTGMKWTALAMACEYEFHERKFIQTLLEQSGHYDLCFYATVLEDWFVDCTKLGPFTLHYSDTGNADQVAKDFCTQHGLDMPFWLPQILEIWAGQCVSRDISTMAVEIQMDPW